MLLMFRVGHFRINIELFRGSGDYQLSHLSACFNVFLYSGKIIRIINFELTEKNVKNFFCILERTFYIF